MAQAVLRVQREGTTECVLQLDEHRIEVRGTVIRIVSYATDSGIECKAHPGTHVIEVIVHGLVASRTPLVS